MRWESRDCRSISAGFTVSTTTIESIAMMAITIKSSMSVNPFRVFARERAQFFLFDAK
jgi:hypothetical protein